MASVIGTKKDATSNLEPPGYSELKQKRKKVIISSSVSSVSEPHKPEEFNGLDQQPRRLRIKNHLNYVFFGSFMSMLLVQAEINHFSDTGRQSLFKIFSKWSLILNKTLYFVFSIYMGINPVVLALLFHPSIVSTMMFGGMNPMTMGGMNNNPMMASRIGMNPMMMGSMGMNPMMMGSMGMNPMMMGGTGLNSMGGSAGVENSIMSGLLQNLISGSQTTNPITTNMQIPSIMGGMSKDSFTENLYANQLIDTIGKNHLLSEKLADIVTSVNRRRAQQNGPHMPFMARNGPPNQMMQQRPPTDNSRQQNPVQQTKKT